MPRVRVKEGNRYGEYAAGAVLDVDEREAAQDCFEPEEARAQRLAASQVTRMRLSQAVQQGLGLTPTGATEGDHYELVRLDPGVPTRAELLAAAPAAMPQDVRDFIDGTRREAEAYVAKERADMSEYVDRVRAEAEAQRKADRDVFEMAVAAMRKDLRTLQQERDEALAGLAAAQEEIVRLRTPPPAPTSPEADRKRAGGR